MKAVMRLIFVACLISLAGCAPEVGTEAWCKAIKDKPKGNWSSNDALDFSKHCVL